MFDDLRKTIDPLFLWQCLQKTIIIQQEFRLPYRPHQVFIDTYIDAILAPDRRIHHSQYRSRNKTKTKAAHIYRRYITRDIGHDSTADTHQKSLPVRTEFDQLFDNAIDGRLNLELLPGTDNDRIPSAKTLLMFAKYMLVGDQHRMRLVNQLLQVRKIRI